MPCYELNTISVDLHVADMATLKAAIEALGLRFTESAGVVTVQTPSGPITIRQGKAEFYNKDCQTWVNKIKQSYSLQTVERIAKRFKFTITTKPGNNIVLRRY